MERDIRVGKLRFTDFSDEGFVLGPKGVKGLSSGTGVRGERIDMPVGHGEFDLPVYRSGRVIELSGLCLSDSAIKVDNYGDQFSGLLAEGKPGRLTVVTHKGTQWMDVTLMPGTVPQFEIFADGQQADFAVQLLSRIPWKYGKTHFFDAGAPTSHYGNVTAAPMHMVTGSMPSGYTVNGPGGRQFIVTAPLVAGFPHRVDMQTGDLFVGGILVDGGVDRPDVWGIPAGTQVTHSLSGSGSGVLVTSVTDTFM